MKRYAAEGSQNTPSTAAGAGAEADAGIISLDGATTVRPHIYFLSVNTEGTPGDQQYSVLGMRYTNGNKGTWGTNSQSGEPMDPADPAASLAKWNANTTAATTVTASSSVWYIGMNNRATYSWSEDAERGIVLDATTDGVGFFFASVTGGTSLVRMSMNWSE